MSVKNAGPIAHYRHLNFGQRVVRDWKLNKWKYLRYDNLKETIQYVPFCIFHPARVLNFALMLFTEPINIFHHQALFFINELLISFDALEFLLFLLEISLKRPVCPVYKNACIRTEVLIIIQLHSRRDNTLF